MSTMRSFKFGPSRRMPLPPTCRQTAWPRSTRAGLKLAGSTRRPHSRFGTKKGPWLGKVVLLKMAKDLCFFPTQSPVQVAHVWPIVHVSPSASWLIFVRARMGQGPVCCGRNTSFYATTLPALVTVDAPSSNISTPTPRRSLLGILSLKVRLRRANDPDLVTANITPGVE